MKRNGVAFVAMIGVSAALASTGCSGSKNGPGFDSSETVDQAHVDGGTTDNAPALAGDFDGGSTNGCRWFDGTDHDGDGFSAQDGDCNDCDPNMNPGAYDVDKNGLDEDCSGVAD